MIKLTIDNSECQITGLTGPQFKTLKELLSYKISSQKTFYSGDWRSQTKPLIDKHGRFPTGLLYIAEKFLGTLKLTHSSFTMHDNRISPHHVKSFSDGKLGYTPYPEQLEAALAAACAGRGIIVMPTGVGKSLVAALIIRNLKVRTLIVTPTVELKNQLISSLTNIFTSQKVGSFCDNKFIAVQNVDSLDPSEPCDYDCVIIDEFHHSGASTYRKLNKRAWNKVYYKFGLTATPFRSNDDERLLLESVLSKVIYRIEHKDAVAKGYICPIEAYYVEVNTTINISGNPSSWPAMYSELVVNNKVRNTLVHDFLLKLHTENLSTLCLVKEIKHGELITQNLPIPFMNGTNDDNRYLLDMFNTKQDPVLVGTNGVLGEGIDTKPAEYIIIAGLGKSKNQFMQQCGRGFRVYPGKESCKVILFKDKSHKWTLSHFNAQVKYLKDEYGIVPIKINLTK